MVAVEDARPGDLWSRLLAGRVTEVYVLAAQRLHRVLPQTLGLEVISPDAYVYGRYGTLRTPAEQMDIARELAAGSRWLAVGGLPFWAQYFARRAEAILIFLGFGVSGGLGQGLGTRWGRPRRTPEQYRPRDREELEDEGSELVRRLYMFDRSLTNDEYRLYFIHMRDYLLGTFPDKSIVVEGRERMAGLRAVRAR